MPLPAVAFYSIYEVSARWGCSAADVAGWAASGHLRAMIGIEPVQCGDDLHGGLVEVSLAELMPLFRRFGPSDETCRLRRILPAGSETWLRVTEPSEGILVRATDLMFPAEALHRFEEERELLRRSSHGTGAGSRYDWEAMTIWLFKRLNEMGFPASQAALIAEVQDWFIASSTSGDVPEESTIRKRIAPIWRAVRGGD
ncbi:MAG: hypothetical protein JJU15_19560 [Pararhodobacter sp.]|nr:hypothetical protein [Pararhodobacter sp.]